VLNKQQVPEVVRRYRKGETQRDLAISFGVSQPAISAIVRGKSWKRDTARFDLEQRRRNVRDRKLSDAKIRAVRDAYTSGQTQKYLADRYGVSKALIQQIVTNKTWKHVL
jgi:transcriptional regulator with XRE-family HTH domain